MRPDKLEILLTIIIFALAGLAIVTALNILSGPIARLLWGGG